MDCRELRKHRQEKYFEDGLVFLNKHMNKIKRLLKWIPEIYLMFSVLYYWSGTGFLFNPIAFIFLFSLIFQCIMKYKVTGILISIFFVIINLYLVLALSSELLSMYNEIQTFDNAQKTLLFFGSIYMGLNITMGIMMFIKYIKLNNQSAVQIAV